MRCTKCGKELVAMTIYVEADFLREHPNEQPYMLLTTAPFPSVWHGAAAGGPMMEYPCQHEPDQVTSEGK